MPTKTIATGTVHQITAAIKKALIAEPTALGVWEDITPLARNEWICWMTAAKQAETNDKRISVGIDKLLTGMRRPCCWAGCAHRTK